MQQHRNKIIVGAAFGIGVVAVTLLLSDVRELASLAVVFPWLLMIPVLALRCANWFLRFIKWHYYLHVVGVEGLRRDDSAAVFLSGFVLSLSPGKVAEFLKSYIIRGLTGTPASQTFPVIAAERLSDGLAVIVLLAVSVVALSASQYWPMVVVPLAVLGLLIVVLQYRTLCLRLLALAESMPLVRRLVSSLRTFYESSYELVQWRPLVSAISLGFGANLLDGAGVFLILVGVGHTPSVELFFQALLVISLSVIVGSLSGLPGGLGAADFSIGASLHLLIGLDTALAGFTTLLIRFVQLWWGVIVGFVVGFLYRHRLFTPELETALDAQQEATPVV